MIPPHVIRELVRLFVIFVTIMERLLIFIKIVLLGAHERHLRLFLVVQWCDLSVLSLRLGHAGLLKAGQTAISLAAFCLLALVVRGDAREDSTIVVSHLSLPEQCRGRSVGSILFLGARNGAIV